MIDTASHAPRRCPLTVIRWPGAHLTVPSSCTFGFSSEIRREEAHKAKDEPPRSVEIKALRNP
jgi:hypothetical protein